MIRFDAIGMKAAEKYFKTAGKRIEKATFHASKAVGFEYKKRLASEIAVGKPGGKSHAKAKGARGGGHLTEVQKSYVSAKGRKSRKYIAGGDLGKYIRMGIQNRFPYTLDIGLLSSGPYAAPKKQIQRAVKMQKGSTARVTPRLRKHFRRYGSEFNESWKTTSSRSGAMSPGRRKEKGNFELRHDTKKLVTPARKFIRPFRKHYEREIKNDWAKVYWAFFNGRKLRL